MNFDLNNTEWTELTNLVDDTTYILQAKVGEYSYKTINILFTQSDSAPTELNAGLWGESFKFKKVSGKNIYVRTVNTITVNVQIEEVV